ncbi:MULTISPECIES: DNA-binding protein [Xanthomonas]|uniref:DNA-binding protein n=1 Tax=Xanthomonas TaxID=338 RepID=UPI002010EFAE|nr:MULTISPECIES: DNA-binding protein [Xanthomonas]MCL1560845.1 DNA-binding protein [Xanthomonas nasturtii]MDV2452667.1 DNA-binding protein [Xanthomonas hortorum NBC5720]
MKTSNKSSSLRTPDQAKSWLRDNGVTVSQFARSHGISRDVVADLLRGRTRGNYGKTHSAAVALGLKPRPDSAIEIPKASQK